MALNHRQKVKLARRLQKPSERYAGIFHSQAWLERKWQIRMRVLRHEAVAKAYAAARRKNKMAKTLPEVFV